MNDEDINTLYEDITAEKKQLKAAHKRKGANTKKSIKVRSSVQVARDEYKATRKLHRKYMREIRGDARRKLRQHKLLIKQARTAYKIVKLSK